jgi:hypothetical protein
MEVTMEMQTAEVQSTQRLGSKPHNLIASDRVEGTPVRRPNGE